MSGSPLVFLIVVLITGVPITKIICDTVLKLPNLSSGSAGKMEDYVFFIEETRRKNHRSGNLCGVSTNSSGGFARGRFTAYRYTTGE